MKQFNYIFLLFIVTIAAIGCKQAATNKQGCTIEFYLTKSNTSFSQLSLADLQDSAIIKDSEIKHFCIQKDTVHINDSIRIVEVHQFVLDSVALRRIASTNFPFTGEPFALVVNGEIAYKGYFWNTISSVGCEDIVAFVWNSIFIHRSLPDYGLDSSINDPRQNSILFDCLKATNRFQEKQSNL